MLSGIVLRFLGAFQDSAEIDLVLSRTVLRLTQNYPGQGLDLLGAIQDRAEIDSVRSRTVLRLTQIDLVLHIPVCHFLFVLHFLLNFIPRHGLTYTSFSNWHCSPNLVCHLSQRPWVVCLRKQRYSVVL